MRRILGCGRRRPTALEWKRHLASQFERTELASERYGARRH
jgi:hypothetical protein